MSVDTWPKAVETCPKAVHVRGNSLQTWPKAVHICAKVVHILRFLTRQPFGSLNGGFVGVTVGVCLGAMHSDHRGFNKSRA